MNSKIRNCRATAGLLLIAVLPLAAEVVTDGMVSPALDLPGPDYRIGAELGTARGSHVFHSFQRVGIETGGGIDFFFINPAGIVFGPNGSIDVPAALHIGTAATGT